MIQEPAAAAAAAEEEVVLMRQRELSWFYLSSKRIDLARMLVAMAVEVAAVMVVVGKANSEVEDRIDSQDSQHSFVSASSFFF